jgi:phage terminase large subunit-like protein
MDQVSSHLIDAGVNVVQFGQGYKSMNPAVDALENSVLKQEIEHFSNPVLSWMIGNVSVKKDPAGQRKFDKDKCHDKIDGPVALAMAHLRATLNVSQVSTWDEIKTI